MSLYCMLFGHDWGRQENIREKPISNDISILFPLLPFIALLSIFVGPPRDCDRTCLRCQKKKTFTYDRERGQ